jgi:hypothetical protein
MERRESWPRGQTEAGQPSSGTMPNLPLSELTKKINGTSLMCDGTSQVCKILFSVLTMYKYKMFQLLAIGAVGRSGLTF